MNRLFSFFASAIFLIIPFLASAQSFDSTMRSSGRIYVVVGVILIILFGLILYLVRIDRKISRLKRDSD